MFTSLEKYITTIEVLYYPQNKSATRELIILQGGCRFKHKLGQNFKAFVKDLYVYSTRMYIEVFSSFKLKYFCLRVFSSSRLLSSCSTLDQILIYTRMAIVSALQELSLREVQIYLTYNTYIEYIIIHINTFYLPSAEYIYYKYLTKSLLYSTTIFTKDKVKKFILEKCNNAFRAYYQVYSKYRQKLIVFINLTNQ